MADPFLSEIKYVGNRDGDFIEIAVDEGTDVSALELTIYRSDGTVRTSNSLDGITPTQSEGKDVYVIDTQSSDTFNGVARSNGVALSEGAEVYSFVSFRDTPEAITATEGPANGLTSTEVGPDPRGGSIVSDDGETFTPEDDPNPGSVPCLTRGTLVETSDGDVKVEDLRDDMTVLTIDGQYRSAPHRLSRVITAAEMQANPKLRPIRICAGALGDGLPKRDLLVSRQHRMLVRSAIAQRLFGEPEVLVAAIRLTELPGIFVDTEVHEVEYIHLLFDSHEVIYAEGAPTESLFTGPEALKALAPAAREEIMTLFPQIADQSGAPEPRRPIPSNKNQNQLVRQHAQNGAPLLDTRH
ncbi:Hint domain-containing protein [Aestuariibius insulae]|uniref:Hint domain-containing protein n=1 Tax=Aestuariibius insulae TaxID=2058287 RepID=UPI00345E1553